MEVLPPFGVQLARLAEVRGVDLDSLTGQRTVGRTRTRSVQTSGEPDPATLRLLAPALGLHRSDLFIIAGQQVPADLAPADRAASGPVTSLAWSLTYLPRAVPELRLLAGSLPRQPHPVGPPAPAPARQQYPNSAGGLLLRLLHNRNLDWPGCAYYLHGLGRVGPLAASTIGRIGRNQMPVTPELLIGFGAVLDIPLPDLSTLTGVDVTGAVRTVHPDAAEAAALIWDARSLTADQLQQVNDRAHAIRHERTDELDPAKRCSCPGPR